MHIYANPARFLKVARPLTPWLVWGGAASIALGLAVGLFVAPRDYLQGECVIIMYVHVPAAWLAMGWWSGIAVASLIQLVWRHSPTCFTASSTPGTAAMFLPTSGNTYY